MAAPADVTSLILSNVLIDVGLFLTRDYRRPRGLTLPGDALPCAGLEGSPLAAALCAFAERIEATLADVDDDTLTSLLGCSVDLK